MVKRETAAEVKADKAKTPEQITQEAQDKEFAMQREMDVLERSPERPLDPVAYPPPATSSWVVVPDNDDYWGPGAKAGDHKGHAVQVVQVHTYPNAPAVVTLRCDCSYEWRVTWDGYTMDTAAKALYEATDEARKAHEEARQKELDAARDRAREAAGAGR